MAKSEKYYWIKLKTDFFNDEVIDWILDQPNGCKYIVLYLRLCLLSANNGGFLSHTIGNILVTYDCKKISQLTHIDIDTVMIALKVFEQIGLILREENGALMLPKVPDMVGTSASSRSAEKMRRYRRRKKMKGNETLPPPLPCDGNVFGNEMSDRDKSIEYRDKRLDTRYIDISSKEKDKEKVGSQSSHISRKEKCIELIDGFTSNEELKGALKEWLEQRCKEKAFTANACKRNLSKLAKLSDDTGDMISIVSNSVMNCWKSFFPLKDKTYRNTPQKKRLGENWDSGEPDTWE